jgi:hypothetical protein
VRSDKFFGVLHEADGKDLWALDCPVVQDLPADEQAIRRLRILTARRLRNPDAEGASDLALKKASGTRVF